MAQRPPQIIGRYALMAEISAGVHVGRALGSGRTVAIKRLQTPVAPPKVQHPNVVPILDVVDADGELFLVMEHVDGETLGRLIRATRARGERISPAIVAAIVVGVLRALDAAHEAAVIHRDVSPRNILVGVDGVPRVLDLGVASAKRDLAYVAPERIQRTSEVPRRSDVYAAGVMLWEALTGVRLFVGQNDSEILERVASAQIVAPSARVRSLSSQFDAIALRALASDPSSRFATAREMAIAIETACSPASPSTVGAWVAELAKDELAVRAAIVATTHREAPKPARSRRWLGALALVAIGSVGAAAAVGGRGPEARGDVAVAPSSAIPNVLVIEPPVSHTPSPAKTASLPARAPSQRPARAVRAHCDPPYTIDDAGSRRFKPECF
jgi:eukaryotic-like serine/threonine-protein kinase